MVNNKNESIKKFEQYAEDTLKNHVAELNTRYENEKIDKETLQEAYRQHQKIFDTELDEKIQSLSSAESDSGLKGELGNLKDDYLSKLNLKNQ